MNQQIPKWAVEKRRRQLMREQRIRRAFLSSLPSSYPKPIADREWEAYWHLRSWWSHRQIKLFVQMYATDEIVSLDTGSLSLTEFLNLIGVLAHGRYARTLPRNEM